MNLLKEKLKNSNILFYICIFLFITMLSLIFNTIDADYWARLIQGSAFWNLGEILKQDIFSYTPSHLWIDHEWGSSVIFYFVQNLSGFCAVIWLKILIIFSIVVLCFKTASNSRNNLFNLIYYVLFILAVPTITFSGIRCHFFTFLFFSLFLYILENARNNKNFKLLYILPVLMLFWSNIHGGCVSGLGLLAIYLFGEFLNKHPFKHYLYSLLLCSSVILINPYGIIYIKFLLTAVTMPRPYVTEWMSPFVNFSSRMLDVFRIVYILNLIVFIINIKKFLKDYTSLFVMLVCAYMSYKYIKNTPFFIIVSSVFLYKIYFEFLKEKLEKLTKYKFEYYIYILLLISFIITLFRYPFAPILTYEPYKIAEFIKINNLKGNILSPFDMGSFLIYKLFPNNLLYMDGRYEEVYFNETKEYLDNFYNLKNEWDKILKLPYRPDYIIIPNNASADDKFDNKGEYIFIYTDDVNNLYIRKELLKDKYIKPSDDKDYYNKNAFETPIKFQKLK